MDLKLSTVLTIMIKATASARTLYDDLSVREHDTAQKNTILKGRQAMLTLLQYFRTNRQMEFVYSIEDLAALTWLGDRETHTFRHK